MIVIFNGCVVIFLDHALFDQLMDRVECQIRVDCAGTVAEQCCEMVHLARLAGLQNNRKRQFSFSFLPDADEPQIQPGGMESPHGSHRRRGQRESGCWRLSRCARSTSTKQAVHRTVKRCALVVGDRNSHCLEAFDFHVLDLQHIGIGQDRIVDL